MSPRVCREDGSAIWTGADADPDYVIEQGIVAYTRSLEQAQAHPRAGKNPLILRATGRESGKFTADPALKPDDADLLLKAAARDRFLESFRVVFVID
jgi:hypothetical protein